jgi:hypothetical protein
MTPELRKAIRTANFMLALVIAVVIVLGGCTLLIFTFVDHGLYVLAGLVGVAMLGIWWCSMVIDQMRLNRPRK